MLRCPNIPQVSACGLRHSNQAAGQQQRSINLKPAEYWRENESRWSESYWPRNRGMFVFPGKFISAAGTVAATNTRFAVLSWKDWIGQHVFYFWKTSKTFCKREVNGTYLPHRQNPFGPSFIAAGRASCELDFTDLELNEIWKTNLSYFPVPTFLTQCVSVARMSDDTTKRMVDNGCLGERKQELAMSGNSNVAAGWSLVQLYNSLNTLQ